MRFVNRWRMPLIFVVSGVRIMLALGNALARRLCPRPRCAACLLPLAFGMVVLVPPQVYPLSGIYRGQFTGSFLDWLLDAFDGGSIRAGNIELAPSVVPGLRARCSPSPLLPCLLWARSDAGRAASPDRAGQRLASARTGLQWLMVRRRSSPPPILWLAPPHLA